MATDRTDGSESSTRTNEYVVVARRYRPQAFGDLVGQQLVAQALQNAITTDRVGHAYLFTGARGVGKTSTARILGKALNCIQGPTPEPCGQCDICQQITAGEDVDVLEIDGASNRGIDEIRQLRSNVGIRPSRARFKIYIIDEVHMLTKEAFNALLKTLEEPPDHVKFIFCTTEPGKIPITVLSRCQRFDFAPVEVSEIAKRLQQIVQCEGAEAEPQALELLARRANGSMRDSQSLLEQLLSFVGDRLTVDQVHAMLGTARGERLQELLQYLLDRDAAAALQQVQVALDEGVDPGQLAEQLLGSLRDILAVSVGCDGNLLLFHSPSEAEALKGLGHQWGTETLLAAIQVLDHTVTRMRQSTQTRILLETALVRIARLETLDHLTQWLAQVTTSPSAAGSPSSPAVQRPRAARDAGKKKVASTPAEPAPEAARPAAPEAENPVPQPTNGSPLQAHEVAQLWRQALEQLDDITADYAAHAAGVAISGPNRLAVQFRQMYNSSKSFCERPERREKLEQVLSQVAGRRVRLEFVVLPDDKPQAAPTRPSVSIQKRKRELAAHPLVEKACDLFSAEVISVDASQQSPDR